MKFALPLLVSLVASPPPASADEWRPYNANPAYEVFGHMEGGTFRWTASRPAQATPRQNYGISLPSLPSPKQSIVDGTDIGEVAATRKLAAAHVTAGEVSAGQCDRDRRCDDGRCPLRRDDPPPERRHDHERSGDYSQEDLALVGLAVVTFFVVVSGIAVALHRRRQ